ncbi:hypothetical protein B0H19DRAFT_1067106 [Mycena capillaripes]|nr:hypothetical protein B0H19DRAFT_1067106 [Mycena capillaripes]
MLSEQPESIVSTPTAASGWSPLTKDEGRALIRSLLFPGQAPPFVLSEERRKIPQAELNRLSHKIGRENTLCRTQHIRPMHPATPDQRILLTFRRKSYTAPSNQFERDTTPLW